MFRSGYFEDKVKYNTITEAKRLCSKVISKANEEFIVLGGECNSEFYENGSIPHAINKMVEKEIQPRFLFGPNFDIESFDLLKLSDKGKLKMKRLKRKYIGEHFKVADSKFIYIANPHGSLGEDRKGYILSSSKIALEKKMKFEELWRKADDFDVRSMVLKASEFPDDYLTTAWLEKNEAEWGKTSGFIKKIEKEKIRSANMEEINSLKEKLGIQQT